MNTPEHPLVLRLRVLATRWRDNLERREQTILWAGILVFVVTFTALAAWKLWAGAYNALDLAIYRQVAANSIRGDLFGLTIHPHSYLGDHVELFFAVLWPFYALVKHPLVLLFLQNAALALTALPIAKISARIIGRPWHVLFALAFLANPLTQNIAVFEFHLLPFAIPILAWAILAYMNQHFGRFLLLSGLAMTVREDVALVVIGFGLLALVDRRSWRWSVVPLVLGGAWFFGALQLAGSFSGYGQYKFLAYYGWLGDGPGAILQTMVTKPWLVIQHVLRVPRVILALALLLPFAYLPLLRGRWLIPIIPIIAQIFLAGATGDVVVDTHYPSLLLPFLLIAVVSVFAALRQPPSSGLLRTLAKERVATTTLYAAIVIYSMLTLGPLFQSIPVIAATAKVADRIRLQRLVLRALPDGGTVAGPEDLTGLSDRPRLFSLHYVFLGKKQFSEEDYILPDDATIVVLNQRDVLTFQSLSNGQTGTAGYGRIRSLLTNRDFVLTAILDRYSVWERREGGTTDFSPLFTTSAETSVTGGGTSHGELVFNGWSAPNNRLAAMYQEYHGQQFRILPLDLVFTKTDAARTVYQLEFTFLNKRQEVHRLLMPLGGGLFPTSDWPVNSPVTSRYRLLLPAGVRNGTDLEIRVLNVEGAIGLNGVRSAVPVYSKYEPIGPTIDLGTINL